MVSGGKHLGHTRSISMKNTIETLFIGFLELRLDMCVIIIFYTSRMGHKEMNVIEEGKNVPHGIVESS